MSIKKITCCLIFPVLLVFSACFSPWKGESAAITLNLGAPSSARAMYPPDADTLNLLEHTVILSGPSGTSTHSFPSGSTTVQIDDLVPGQWDITVQAMLDEKLYAEGNVTVEIWAGNNTVVSVQMNRYGEEPIEEPPEEEPPAEEPGEEPGEEPPEAEPIEDPVEEPGEEPGEEPPEEDPPEEEPPVAGPPDTINVTITISLGTFEEWDLLGQTVYVDYGSSANFSVVAGYALYQWYLDTELVQEGSDSEFLLNNNRQISLGIHELIVVVTNETGEKRSGRCRIIIR